MVYQTEKALQDMGDKISAGDKASVEAALNKLKEALKGSDVQAIKNATEEASKAFYPIAEKMYQQANPQGGQAGPDMGGAGFNGSAGSAGSDPQPWWTPTTPSWTTTRSKFQPEAAGRPSRPLLRDVGRGLLGPAAFRRNEVKPNAGTKTRLL